MYVIGVDGGGTKTTATLYNNNLEVLAHFFSGAMNLQVVSEEKIAEIFIDMLKEFNVLAEDVAIGVGAAGAGRIEDIKKLEDILKKLKFKKYSVSNDAHIALLATHGKENGMLIISGTGSIAFALNNKTMYRKGGMGHILGDEGSGYSIGLELLKKIFNNIDLNIENPPKILSEILKVAKVENVNQLLKWVYSSTKGDIAEMAKIVLKNKENIVCKSIIERNIKALIDLIVNLKNVSGCNKIGFTGGIIENDTAIREGLLIELKKIEIVFVERKYSNDYGAALLLD
ncbi:MAG: N-acetylglucosamine kinase [Fusobacteriaceae bacterium]